MFGCTACQVPDQMLGTVANHKSYSGGRSDAGMGMRKREVIMARGLVQQMDADDMPRRCWMHFCVGSVRMLPVACSPREVGNRTRYLPNPVRQKSHFQGGWLWGQQLNLGLADVQTQQSLQSPLVDLLGVTRVADQGGTRDQGRV